MPKTLASWLAYQEQLHPSAIALGLERVRTVAAKLDLPRAGIRTLTVGGTNGKGSTTTLLAGIYRAAGYTVGAYTSPHLLHYSERISLNGGPAGDAQLCAAFEAIEAARGDVPITYFEFGTLAALWLFAEQRVDVQVLEVGLGGRLDAVNIVDADASIVTNIGLDHQDWLGHTLDAIGTEKAGIFRAGRPAICAESRTCNGLIETGKALGAQLIRRDVGDFGWQRQGQGWDWFSASQRLAGLPLPALPGEHQLDNAAGALAAVNALQGLLPVPPTAIHSALRALRLPGRLQWRGRFLLDVAHNAEAAAMLADYLAQQAKPVVWIAGMLSDKPVEAIAAALRPHVQQAIALSLPPPRGLDGKELAARLEAAGIPARPADTAEQAVAAALAASRDNQAILVCGSFLTVAAIAPHCLPEPHP